VRGKKLEQFVLDGRHTFSDEDKFQAVQELIREPNRKLLKKNP
jgi:hypothetical protein